VFCVCVYFVCPATALKWRAVPRLTYRIDPIASTHRIDHA
jgi:hypothetical protein